MLFTTKSIRCNYQHSDTAMAERGSWNDFSVCTFYRTEGVTK